MAVWGVVKKVTDHALGLVLMGQEPELQRHQLLKPRNMPKIMPGPTVIPWVVIARAISTKASMSAMKEYLAKEIIEVGEGG